MASRSRQHRKTVSGVGELFDAGQRIASVRYALHWYVDMIMIDPGGDVTERQTLDGHGSFKGTVRLIDTAFADCLGEYTLRLQDGTELRVFVPQSSMGDRVFNVQSMGDGGEGASMTKDISRYSEAGKFLRAAVKISKGKVDGYAGKTGDPDNLLRGHEVYANLLGAWDRDNDLDRLEVILTDLKEAGLVNPRQGTSEGWNFRVTAEGAKRVDEWSVA